MKTIKILKVSYGIVKRKNKAIKELEAMITKGTKHVLKSFVTQSEVPYQLILDKAIDGTLTSDEIHYQLYNNFKGYFVHDLDHLYNDLLKIRSEDYQKVEEFIDKFLQDMESYLVKNLI